MAAGATALIRVPVSSDGPVFNVGHTETIVRVTMPFSSGFRNTFDLTPDGSRLLVNRLVQSETGPPITLVVNWLASAKR